MKNKDNKNNSNENEIEIIIGDGSDLEISEVNDCMNSLRPKTLNRKKKNITEDSSSSKEFKQFEYNANSKMGKENIDLSLVINSKIDDKKKSIDESGLSIKERIERLELQKFLFKLNNNNFGSA